MSDDMANDERSHDRRPPQGRVAVSGAAVPPPARVASGVVAGGVAAILAAAWLFGGIAEDVVNRDAPLGALDLQVANWLHAHASPALTALMTLITDIGSPLALALATVVAAAILFRRHEPLRYLVLAVPAGALLNVVVKHLVHRHRPTFVDPIEVLTTYSFPSGHAMAATLLYGTIAVVIMRKVRDGRWRAVALLAAALMIVLVAFSRMYLGVHYLSDVVAGVMEGVVWLGICLGALAAFERRRRTA